MGERKISIELKAREIFERSGDARPWRNLPDETVQGYWGRDAYREMARKAIESAPPVAGKD